MDNISALFEGNYDRNVSIFFTSTTGNKPENRILEERSAVFLDTSSFTKGNLPSIANVEDFNLLISRLVINFGLGDLMYKIKKR